MSASGKKVDRVSDEEASTRAEVDGLLTWFARFGGTIHSAIDIASQTDRRGFRLVLNETADATTQSSEQLFISCPHVLAFSVLQIPIVAPWWPASWLSSLDTTVLTRFMLIETELQGVQSTFHPYIAMLPRPDGRPFSTPLYWKEDERATIKGTNLYEATLFREQLWAKEFKDAKEALLQLRPDARDRVEEYSFDLYRWSATVLSSRCFPHWMIEPDQDDDRRPAETTELLAELMQSTLWQRWVAKDASLRFPVLLPVFDLANHNPDARVTWRSANYAAELIGSTENLAVGSEIFNNYGQKANEELILGYGFELPDNAANSFLVALDFSLEAEKLQYIRSLVASALSRDDKTIVLPQILNPGTNLDDMTKIFAMRDKQDPVTSAAATPLSLMSTNTRELRLRAVNPLAVPNIATRLPTRNGLEVLRALVKLLRKDHLKIQATEPDLPFQDDIDASNNMQMGVRHRETQLAIIEHGLASLKLTLVAWQAQHRIVTMRALLRDVGPRPILKKFRQLLHHTLGTRDEDRLHESGHDEAVFVFWIINAMHELDTMDDDEVDDTNPDRMNVVQLRAWVAKMRPKMEAAYGPYGGKREDDIVDGLCWLPEDRAEAEIHVNTYEAMLVESGQLKGIENLREKLSWAVRVIVEECVWIEDWLDPRVEEPCGEEALLWIMEDADEDWVEPADA